MIKQNKDNQIIKLKTNKTKKNKRAKLTKMKNE